MARVILVHGAWHGGWCWERLAPLLEKAGHSVDVVDLPSAGKGGDLAADASVVRSVIERDGGPVVIVGHSYGGMVITEAAVGCPQVAHLVYLCAFMLPQGQSLLDLFGGEVTSWVEIDAATGNSRVPRPVPVFYGDVDPAEAERHGARLSPHSLKSFGDRLTQAAWQTIPSTYVACTQDEAIPYAAQQAMSQRAGAVVVLESSHSPYLSHAGEVAEIIDRVAKQPPPGYVTWSAAGPEDPIEGLRGELVWQNVWLEAIATAWKSDALEEELIRDTAGFLKRHFDYDIPAGLNLSVQRTPPVGGWDPRNQLWYLKNTDLIMYLPRRPALEEQAIALAAFSATGRAYPFTCG